MSAETLLTSDVVGLTKPAPVSRRGFMTASAAVAAGYTLALELINTLRAVAHRAQIVFKLSWRLLVGDYWQT